MGTQLLLDNQIQSKTFSVVLKVGSQNSMNKIHSIEVHVLPSFHQNFWMSQQQQSLGTQNSSFVSVMLVQTCHPAMESNVTMLTNSSSFTITTTGIYKTTISTKIKFHPRVKSIPVCACTPFRSAGCGPGHKPVGEEMQF